MMLAADLTAESPALSVALRLAQLYQARLVAVHVPSLCQAPTEPGVSPTERTAASQGLRERLRQRLEESLAAVPHEVICLEHEAWPAISVLLQENSVRLLVLGGVSSAGGAEGLQSLSGPPSPAQDAFRRATCAVVTVGRRSATPSEAASEARFERILYATDFSVESLAAAPSAVSLASRAKAQLMLLYAQDSRQRDQTDAAMHTLRDLVPLGTRLVARPRCLVEPGGLAEVSLRAATAESASLIVLGIPGPHAETSAANKKAMIAAWKVSCDADCPVLTVRG